MGTLLQLRPLAGTHQGSCTHSTYAFKHCSYQAPMLSSGQPMVGVHSNLGGCALHAKHGGTDCSAFWRASARQPPQHLGLNPFTTQ
jgi:hypothetical protein